MYTYQLRGNKCVDWGHSYTTHITAYWIAKKIKICGPKLLKEETYYEASMGDYKFGDKVGYGSTSGQAIEELLMAMEDK